MLPLAVTGITYALHSTRALFLSQGLCITNIFGASFLITLHYIAAAATGICSSDTRHAFFRITMAGLLLGMVLYVCPS